MPVSAIKEICSLTLIANNAGGTAGVTALVPSEKLLDESFCLRRMNGRKVFTGRDRTQMAAALGS
jgi:hypothetical protein